jgi:hypothetical protein
MVFSPFRSAISHAPRVKPTADDPFDISHRPPGSRRPHPDAKVTQVRRLIETTTMTYAEISKRTGVPYTNISRWTNEGNWTRPPFAPRAPDTVPRWRARANLRRRTLAARIDRLTERRVSALEAVPGIDLPGLREALELLKLGTLADRPHTGRHRTAELTSELDEPQERARVIARRPRHWPISSRAARPAPIRRATRRCASAGGTRSGTRSMQGCEGGSEGAT